MFSCVASLPYLKCKSDRAYLVNKNNMNNDNYYQDTYFVEIEFNKRKIKINDIEIEYQILLCEDDKNLLIKFDILSDSNNLELNKIVYYIENNILEIDYDHRNYKDLDDDILKNYSNKYIKI